MRLTFFGAAGEVTGSCYSVECGRSRVMLDFGIFQGDQDADEKNHRLPEIDFGALDAVVLTHAHLDHSGRMPILEEGGYAEPSKDRGRVWATELTEQLTGIILKDSAGIMAMDAERRSRGKPTQSAMADRPLYGEADVARFMRRFSTARYDEPVEVAEGVQVRLLRAGHIAGAASVEMTLREGGRSVVVVFSGDLGPIGAPMLWDPVPPTAADWLILESTYGDRDHKGLDATLQEFARVLSEAAADRGVVLIPAFAVGRMQELVYHLGELERAGTLPQLEIYVDSPMGLEVTNLYRSHASGADEETQDLLAKGIRPLKYRGLHYVRTADESKALNGISGPAIIISASGMCTGGRIVHHLKNRLANPNTRVLFCGYQGRGTLGRRLVDGAKNVRVLGADIEVRAKVHTLGGFSAHAGQSTLVEWASAMKASKPPTLLTHGEDRQREALAARLKRDLGFRTHLPVYGESIDL
ncbi:MAG: MBL fold metallo-hydrolase [Phycisphaeraceae bacterium]|nr:MBL fold metallo-hydrolase [Phycisphaeraceae bacterium]